MLKTIEVRTHRRDEMIDVTAQVAEAVRECGVKEGYAVVFAPHTTAAVTINENADPDVPHDILLTLEQTVPQRRPGYRHNEGNSDAHVKSSLVGASALVIVENGRLVLGTWQAIFFCEFDGPRSRQLHVQVCGT